MNTVGIFLVGAAAGAMLGLSATLRGKNAARILLGVIAGAVSVAILLGGIATGAGWAATSVHQLGVMAGAAIGTLTGAAAGYLLGVLGAAFFGFLLSPAHGVIETLKASLGRAAIIAGIFGALFGGISGAVLAALKGSGLL
jgi:hypothetical protein